MAALRIQQEHVGCISIYLLVQQSTEFSARVTSCFMLGEAVVLIHGQEIDYVRFFLVSLVFQRKSGNLVSK
jgi:hypothetical protein